MDSTVRFVADAMLGKLARWLRILGYDTLYDASWDDLELARIARAEGRILLTRDVLLSRHRGARTLLIQSEHPKEQLRQVFHFLHLNDARAYSRCPVCNEPLKSVPPQTVRDRLPKFVLANHDTFRECPQCGRIYWPGTHWESMQAVLSGLNDE